MARYRLRHYLIPCVVAALASVLPALPAGVAHAQADAAFTAHYEHLAEVEAQLQAQVATLAPADQARVPALARAATRLDAHVATLYALDQALAATGARPLAEGRLTRAVLPPLRAARDAVAAELKALTAASRKSPVLRPRLAPLIASARAGDQQLLAETNDASRQVREPVVRKSAAAQILLLQAAITQLQNTAIDLIDARLLLANASADSGPPAAVQGLAYTSTSITVPGKGERAATDPVGVQPRVTDASGAVLPNTGSYHLQGPPKFHGVLVDRLIGTVTVRPRATPGRYTVTYTQGRVKEQVVLQVLP